MHGFLCMTMCPSLGGESKKRDTLFCRWDEKARTDTKSERESEQEKGPFYGSQMT